MTAPQQRTPSMQRGENLDQSEVARFEAISKEWWDEKGKFRPLHQIGPARIGFIRDSIISHFGLVSGGLRPLNGLTILDVGCGGGLVCEPLARLGAKVTGIDPGEENVRVASAHAEAQEFDITYCQGTLESLTADGKTFDVVLCLEVVEHVPDVQAFVKACAAAVRPGGLAVFSTLNRTLKSFALAIIGAEYVLGWLPRGTHRWDKFVMPDELRDYCGATGLVPQRLRGVVYDPLQDRWSQSDDTGVNYMLAAAKP